MVWCLAGDKPLPWLPDLMLTQIYDTKWHHSSTMSFKRCQPLQNYNNPSSILGSREPRTDMGDRIETEPNIPAKHSTNLEFTHSLACFCMQCILQSWGLSFPWWRIHMHFKPTISFSSTLFLKQIRKHFWVHCFLLKHQWSWSRLV